MPRILVIDDDTAVRTVLRRALERAGHTVTEADDGTSGIRSYEAEPADLVITDIFMPGQDGIETLRALRRIDRGVRVICLSGGDRSGVFDLREHAVSLGAMATMAKPIEIAVLLKTVDAALARPRPENDSPRP